MSNCWLQGDLYTLPITSNGIHSFTAEQAKTLPNIVIQRNLWCKHTLAMVQSLPYISSQLFGGPNSITRNLKFPIKISNVTICASISMTKHESEGCTTREAAGSTEFCSMKPYHILCSVWCCPTPHTPGNASSITSWKWYFSQSRKPWQPLQQIVGNSLAIFT